MTDEAILAQIKKVLALTTSDSAGEASNAQALAQKLLLKYHVSEEELEGFSLTKSETVTEVRTTGKSANNKIFWYNALANTVAKANLCNLLTSGAGLIWIGKPTDIEVAQYLFQTVVEDLTRICDLTWQIVNYRQSHLSKYAKVHGKTWKNSFYVGANQTISERLNANLQQLRSSDNDINALVVMNDHEIKEYMKVKYPRLTYSSSNSRRDRSGFEAGKEAGRSIQFRQGVGAGGSSGPKLLNRG